MDAKFGLLFLFLALLQFVLALAACIVATRKRGFFVGLLHLLFGLIFSPIALLSAVLEKEPAPTPLRADGFIGGKPWWRKGGRYVARVDGRDILFDSREQMQEALGAEARPTTREDEPELIGAKLVRKITEM